MKGKTVSAVPPVSRARSKFDYDSPALVAKMTGQPVLARTKAPESNIKSVRGYKRAPFVTDEGRILVEVRNSSIHEDGKRYGDVYFTWIPTTPAKESK